MQNEYARSIVMAAIDSVDLVTLFEDDTPLRLINLLKPDYLIKGADYTLQPSSAPIGQRVWGEGHFGAARKRAQHHLDYCARERRGGMIVAPLQRGATQR